MTRLDRLVFVAAGTRLALLHPMNGLLAPLLPERDTPGAARR